MDATITSVYGMKLHSYLDLMKYESMLTRIQAIKREMGDKYIHSPNFQRKPIWS